MRWPCIDITKCYGVISISISKRERERERDRQTDRGINRNRHTHVDSAVAVDFAVDIFIDITKCYGMISISRERKRERWHRNFSTHDFHTVETLCKGYYEEFQKVYQRGFEPAIPRTTVLMANHYTTNFPPKCGDISIDITKCYGMISRERERERERRTHRHTHRHTIFILLKHSVKVIMRNSKRFINEFWTRDPPHDSFDV